MRFCYYKLINDLCASLIEAAGYIFNSGDASLWPMCTEAVNTIEQTLSVNKDSVSSRNIFDICSKLKENIAIYQNGEDNGQEIISNITELVSECKNSISFRLRVLFVADLGGKWDSMDSVYYAFKNRDDCDVDVVIQPIFRQRTAPDGSTISEVICDDYLTPMGIKNIPYREYDMEKIAPDITFISQPYESVTVPMFWPENIAKVSRLVYLPYYMATFYDKEIASATYETFFKSTTERYAWKIPCQSEAMKKYYEETASNKGSNVIVTGIPKWDYPLKLNKKNTAMPQKWKKKCEGRTVFLWNTHFTSGSRSINLFNQGEELLHIIAKNKKAALIWRPHPMTETVIKVYTPEKIPQYKKILKFIADSDNIVIDKNPTYDCAFVWSDALITEVSSLADQYMLTGKPILYASTLNRVKIRNRYCASATLFDYSKVKWGCSLGDIEKFISSIQSGIDDNKDDRKYILDKYYPFADGNVGERFTEQLIEKFLEENT